MRKHHLFLVIEACNFIFFRLNKLKILIPNKLNQLNSWQLTRLAPYLLNNDQTDKYSSLYLTYIFYLKHPSFKNFYRLIHLVLRVPFEELQKHTEFLYHGVRLTRFITLKGFIGPATLLKDLTLDEFILTERYYSNYLQKKEINDLDYLVAILYRKATCSHRSHFNKNDLSEYVRPIRKIKPKRKMIIVVAYKGSRDFVKRTFKKDIIIKN